MMRTVLIALVYLALASAPGGAQDDAYTCYKTKDLKQPQFAGSTADSVSDELAIDSDSAVKKRFLHCTWTARQAGALMNATTELICYKIKWSDSGPDDNVDDAARTATESEQRKTYVLCVPAKTS